MNNNSNNNETEVKMKMFKQALDNGECDHLHEDQSFSGRYTSKLWRIADAATKEETIAGSQDEQLQSIIGMVYTLVINGRSGELQDALKQSFSEYYIMERAS